MPLASLSPSYRVHTSDLLALNLVQPLSTWKGARNHLFGSSFLSFVYCTGPDPRPQEFSTFSFPQ